MTVAIENAQTNVVYWRTRCLKAEAINADLLAALEAAQSWLRPDMDENPMFDALCAQISAAIQKART